VTDFGEWNLKNHLFCFKKSSFRPFSKNGDVIYEYYAYDIPVSLGYLKGDPMSQLSVEEKICEIYSRDSPDNIPAYVVCPFPLKEGEFLR